MTSSPAPALAGLLQPRCACGQHTIGGSECEECRKKSEAACVGGGSLQRAAVNREPVSEVPPIVYDVLRSPGQPLDAQTRAFFEPRFGHDFSQVRVHTDARAAESSQAVNALAYTVGRQVVFGAGQYAPETSAGQKLLAHELTHVVQQNTEGRISCVQRWSYGKGAPPHSDYREIPAPHKTRVEEGMNLVSRVVNSPKEYAACYKFFKAHCAGGTATSLIDKFNAATLWFDTDNTAWGSGVDPDQVAYSDATYRMGRWFIGSVMMHEFMHRCGQHNENINDQAIKNCGFRDVEITKGKIVEKR